MKQLFFYDETQMSSDLLYVSDSVSTLPTLILTSVRVLTTSQIDKKIKGD